jgi:hypothetical protein
MLQHAVRKDEIERLPSKGQVSGVRDYELSLRSELSGNRSSGVNCLVRRVDANRDETCSTCRDAPPSPVASNIEEPRTGGRYGAKEWNWIGREVSNERPVHDPVGPFDGGLNKRVDAHLTGFPCAIDQDVIGQLEGPGCRPVAMLDIVPQKNRDPVHDAMRMTCGTLQPCVECLQWLAVKGTNEIIQKPRVKWHVTARDVVQSESIESSRANQL